jgi:hypothetical protein
VQGIQGIAGELIEGFISCIDVYDATGGTNVTSVDTVILDTERINTASSIFTLSTNTVEINADITASVIYRVSTDVSTGTNRSLTTAWLEIDTGAGFSEVAGSRVYMYNRQATAGGNTGTAALILSLNTGDILRIRCQRIQGTDTTVTIANGSSLTIVDLSNSLIGSQGVMGIQGPFGVQGIQGIDGAYAAQGIQGIKGDSGDTGTQGTQGIQGLQGITGGTGNTGDTGIQGIKGDTGDTGLQGIQGVQGIIGTTGDSGVQGLQGAQGVQGITGDEGSQGIQGVQGTLGLQGTTGNTGDTGIQGTQGTTGDTGTQGTVGSMGDTGVQGVQGVQGNTGIQGTDGTTGTQGIQGVQGVTGDFNEPFVGINDQTGTTYTLVLGDAAIYVRCNNASPITVTVPKNSVTAFTTGTVITIEQKGAGQVTVSPVDGDVTINAYNGSKTAGQYAVVQVVKVATDVWTLIGGVA